MRHVIIGAGAAGITAAKTIRQLQPDSEITVISKEKEVHSRCMLHKYLSGERTAEEINFAPDRFFEDMKITHLHGAEVIGVLPKEQKVNLSDGKQIVYDRLLIATGAFYVVPPIPGFRTASNVYGFRDLSDAQAIDRVTEAGKKVVIVGSGLVGMDAAYALLNRGVKPDIVEMAGRIMPLQLDNKGALAYQRLFEEAGCRFWLNTGAADTKLDDNGDIRAVVLGDGTELACDYVIIAAGVRPAIGFLEGSGVETERAVKVDSGLLTSVDGIYAAGDAAGLSGIWPNAMKQGITAAKNMCGGSVKYEDTYAMKNTINFFGLTSLCIGNINEEGAGLQVYTIEDQSRYGKALTEDGVLKSILLQGSIDYGGIYQYLIKNRVKLKADGRDIFRLSFADYYGFEPENGKYVWEEASV